VPIIRTWVSGRGGHPDCDGTCREFATTRELLEFFHDARRAVATGGGLPDPGPLKPPRCPTPPKAKRELVRALAAARAEVDQQEAELRARSAATRRPAGASHGGPGWGPQV
jgi:hypothetical protein